MEKLHSQEVLSRAHVVAGTLSSIGSLTVASIFKALARDRKQAFNCVIIDEVLYFDLSRSNNYFMPIPKIPLCRLIPCNIFQ